MRRRLAVALAGASMFLALDATLVAAHPLGNFTINHYAGIRVEPDRVLLDVVIDEAEIPTFQAFQVLDANGDGAMSAAEIEAARVPSCATVGSALILTVDGATVPLQLVAAGLSFPPGSGGLSTMRIVCELDATRSFNLVLTPQYDWGHRDHLHLEVRSGIRWQLIQ